MFFRSRKSIPRPAGRQPGDAGGQGFSPALTAAQVIEAFELERPIAAISQLAAVPDRHFERYYRPPVDRLLALSQHLGRHGVRGRLDAVVRGLKLRRSLLLPAGVESEAIRRHKDLWTYAVFISLLLYNIGPLLLGRVILVRQSVAAADPPRQWPPLFGPLQPPQVYKIVGEQPATIHGSFYFLHLLLDDAGLAWIAQDIKALNAVAELVATPDPDSLLGSLVLKAHNALPDENVSSQSIEHDAETVRNACDDGESPLATDTGEQFYNWLQQHIKDTSSSELEPYCFNTSNGLALVSPDIFRKYSDENGGARKTVQKAFLRLKHHLSDPRSGSDFHTLTVPGRGNINTIIVPGLSVRKQDKNTS